MIEIPFSEACERNKQVILETITPVLGSLNSVLEIGSGTAQHAIHFAQALPHLRWQCSDQANYLPGIDAALANARNILASQSSDHNIDNIIEPFELNVNQDPWLVEPQLFDAVYTANTFHIMTERDVQAFFDGLATVTKVGSHLMVYGPFKYRGEFTSQSNHEFDQRLRDRGYGSGIRDFEWVNQLAAEQGFEKLSDTAMPANNQCIIWQKTH